MSKNVQVNGVDYSGVSMVQLPLVDGGTALFQDVDEITPSGGAVETGTFVGGGGLTATINVTSKKSGVLVWMENLNDEVANLANQDRVVYFADEACTITANVCVYEGKKQTQSTTGTADKLPAFNDTTIVISKPVAYAQEKFVSGKTYHWKAW
jgi:hypothetical protein